MSDSNRQEDAGAFAGDPALGQPSLGSPARDETTEEALLALEKQGLVRRVDPSEFLDGKFAGAGAETGRWDGASIVPSAPKSDDVVGEPAEAVAEREARAASEGASTRFATDLSRVAQSLASSEPDNAPTRKANLGPDGGSEEFAEGGAPTGCVLVLNLIEREARDAATHYASLIRGVNPKRANEIDARVQTVHTAVTNKDR